MTKFEKWLREEEFPHLTILGSVQWDYCGDAWEAAIKCSNEKIEKLIKKYSVPKMWTMKGIRKDLQILKDECSKTYLGK